VGDGLSTLPRDVNWLAALGSASEACLLLGDACRAAELRTLLEPYRTRMVVAARGSSHGASRRAPAFVVRDLRHHGEFPKTIGQHDRAEDLIAEAAARAQSLGFTYGAGED
jgi:hypothetical protein